jgi:hypothetical protein
MLKNFFHFTQSSSPQLIITIEFLTHSEKKKKTEALENLNLEKKKLESENNDYEVEINPFSLYLASLRVNIEVFEQAFNLNEIFICSKGNEFAKLRSEFLQISNYFYSNVKEFVILVGDRQIFETQKNIMDIQNHDVIEIVYNSKPDWEIIWLKTKKYIGDWFARMWGLLKKGGFLFMMSGIFKSSWTFKLILGYFFPWLLLF